jgi:hypothetical protein
MYDEPAATAVPVEPPTSTLPAAEAAEPGTPPAPDSEPEVESEPDRSSDPDATQASPAVDPDATMAAPAPIWTEEYAEPEAWDAPPPPPPLEEIPERPLFADHERRVPPGAPPPPTAGDRATGTGARGGAGSKTGSETGDTGAGAGSRYWPFDDPDATGGFSGREGRSWLQLAGIVALAIAVLVGMFIAFDLGRGKDEPSGGPTGSPSKPAATGSPLRIVGAHDFDPEGDPPSENPDEVPLAIDGKPGTGWRTMTYRDDPHLGGLKSGVGLVLDLGSQQEVGSVEVTLVGAPTDLELWATPPGDNDPPAELSDTRRIASLSADGTTALLRVDPAQHTRFLVVWLTKLPPVTGGFRGEIAEVTVRS